MRKIFFLAGFAAVLGGCAANQKNTVELLKTDPKYNSPECVSIRDAHYNDGTMEERMASRIIGSAMWGGGFAVTMAERRKHEMLDRQIELACMSNPPDRSYLDPNATTTKN